MRNSARRNLWLVAAAWVGSYCTSAGVTSAAAARETQPEPAAGSSSNGGPATGDKPETYWLRVTSDRVHLRSRADRNSVAVALLDQDTVLQALGSEFGWWRVLPPEGTFSYVAAEFVDQLGPDHGLVSVRSGQLRVRVGSLITELDPSRSEVQARLSRGTPVRIVGRTGDWLKIVPPEGVYLYVLDQYVERISPEVAEGLRAAAAAKRLQPGATATAPATTRPTTAPDLSGAWGQRLLLVEALIQAEARRPPLEQSWTGALAQLRPIAEQREEPMVARLAREWIARLEERRADQEALRAAQAIRQREERDRVQFDREKGQIERVRRPASGPAFAAQGQLLESFVLRDGRAGPRYKLQDPLTNRIVAYVEIPSAVRLKVTDFVGRYVGVRGARRPDALLGTDVIRATEIELLSREAPASRPARNVP